MLRFLSALSTLLELVGFVLVVTAGWFVDWRLGSAVAGVVCILAGYLIDRPARIDE